MTLSTLKEIEGYAKELLLDTRLLEDSWVQIRLPDTYANVHVITVDSDISYPNFVEPIKEWVVVTFTCAMFPEKFKEKNWNELARATATFSKLTYDIFLDEEYPKELKLKFVIPLIALNKNLFQVYLLEAIHNARELSRMTQRAYSVISPTEILEYFEAKQKESDSTPS